jgi:small subunit ribosomal protein S6
MFHIDAPSDAVIEMERNMGLSEDVLRHLTIRLDELPEGPSIMMQAKSDRGDRGDRGRRPDRDDRPPRFDRDDKGDTPRAERAAEAVPDDTPKAEPDAS